MKHLRHFCTQGTEKKKNIGWAAPKINFEERTLLCESWKRERIHWTSLFMDATPLQKIRGRGTYCERLSVLLSAQRSHKLRSGRELTETETAQCNSTGHYNSYRTERKDKDVPLQELTNPYGARRWRLPEFLDNWHIKVGKAVSLTHRPLFTPRRYRRYSFLLETESTPGQ